MIHSVGFRYGRLFLAFVILTSGALAQPVSPPAKVPGVVIDYSPASSGRYIGSPSLVVLPDGTYVASHDFFGPKAGHTVAADSVVFESKDQGRSWKKIADIHPLFWGKLFVHQKKLYLLGTRHEYGDVLLRRSDDGGHTWTEPNDTKSGLLRQGTYHCAPCRTLVHEGRIWRSFERFTGGGWGNFSALVISAPVDADLLDAASWTFSEERPKQKDYAWLEGNLVVDPQGDLLNMLRTNRAGDDRAAIVRVDPGGKKLTYDPKHDFIPMPGGGVKFTIRYDAKSGKYWSIVSKQTGPVAYRNNLVLTSSKDLRTWRVESPLLYHPDAEHHAWQYIDWQFDGADIIFTSRTAYDDQDGGAHRAHDANYFTFHRVKDFRDREPGPLVEE